LWADVCFGKTLDWLKLSNSGDLLKILILSYSWKIISGWTNHSGIVISQNMNESEMENRGSKSAEIAVKEQRVDGSWLLNKIAEESYFIYLREYNLRERCSGGESKINTFKMYSNGFRKKLSTQNPY